MSVSLMGLVWDRAPYEGGTLLVLLALAGLLRAFDATWWLANCHRSGGQLVFDYETRLVEDHPHV